MQLTRTVVNEVKNMPHIDSGSFSHIYSLNDSFVLRKFLYSRDSRAFYWLLMCKHFHTENKCLPRVVDVKVYNGDVYCVMEKLKVNRDRAIKFSDSYNFGDKLNSVFLEEFISAIAILGRFTHFIGGSDIHSGNILFRGRCPVLTDPVCGYTKDRMSYRQMKEIIYG